MPEYVKKKIRHEMGLIIPQDADSEEDANYRLSFLKDVMAKTVEHQISALKDGKIARAKFILHEPAKDCVLPLFTGHFKITFMQEVTPQPSSLKIVEEEDIDKVDEKESTG